MMEAINPQPLVHGDSVAEKTSVLLLDGESTFAVSVARCLASVPGISVHALSSRADCPLRFSRTCKSIHAWDEGETTLSVAAISRAILRTGASVVMAVDTPGIRFASAHAEQLREMAALAPVATLDVLGAVENKWSLAGLLAEHGLAHPPTLLVSADEEFAQSLSTFPFPVLLKPAMGGYGRGIRYFPDRNSLLDFLQHDPGEQPQYIVQSYVPGKDIDCSVLCHQGKILAYTIQEGFVPSPRPFSPAGGVAFVEDDQVLRTVTQLVSRLRWSGVAHIDLRYDSRGGKPFVIEINPRFWGSLLGSLSAGVNFPHLASCAALGISFPETQRRVARFVSGGAALMQWLGPLWRGRLASFSFRETSLRYALADPGPEFFEAIKACWEAVRQRWRQWGRALATTSYLVSLLNLFQEWGQDL